MKSRVEMVWDLRLLLICVGVACVGSLLAQDRTPSLGNVKTKNVEFIARELQRCPCWLNVPVDEVARREEITDLYLKLADYDTETIRAGIASYLSEEKIADPGTFYAGAKVFALLRVVFQVPQYVVATGEFYSMGNPVHDGSIELLWPYSMDGAGRLVLTGSALVGYTGLPADPLKEFDKFASRFGRRRLGTGSSAGTGGQK
jgi:hypothetical protein